MGPKDDDLHYVTRADELDVGDRAIIEIKGREIAVFNVGDGFEAVGNHCPHMGGPTCEGLLSGMVAMNDDGEMVYERENEIISCPWHGWEFDVRTGEHLGGSKKRLLTYDVVVRDGNVYVDL